jgi:hypothetical protein
MRIDVQRAQLEAQIKILSQLEDLQKYFNVIKTIITSKNTLFKLAYEMRKYHHDHHPSKKRTG